MKKGKQTMTTRITKKLAIATALKAYENANTNDSPEFRDEIIAILNKEIDNLSKPKAPSAKSKANDGLKDIIYDILSDVPTTISELMKHPALIGNSNQKLTALVSALVKDGKAVRTVEKRVAYFTKAE